MDFLLQALALPSFIEAVAVPFLLSSIMLYQGMRHQKMDLRFIPVWLAASFFAFYYAGWIPDGDGVSIGYHFMPLFGGVAVMLRIFWVLSLRMLFALTFFSTLVVDMAGGILYHAKVYHNGSMFWIGLGGDGLHDALIWAPCLITLLGAGLHMWVRFRKYPYFVQNAL